VTRNVLIGIASLALSSFGHSQVKISTETYRGWENSYRLSNGSIEVVVVPQIGRVMHYSEQRQANLLWENLALGPKDSSATGYKNFGGDKVWYAPQTIWTWPPDPMIDGAPMKAEVIKDGIRLTSEIGKIVPVRVIREIKIQSLGNEVKFTNKMVNYGPERELSIWQVTQIDNPLLVEMPIDFNSTYKILIGDKINGRVHRVESSRLLINRDSKKSFKFGVSSKVGTLKATVGRVLMETRSPWVRKARYPDMGSSLEVYTNPDPDKYVELEHLSPLIRMGTKEIAIQTVSWRIRDAK
jgi:hypothetical protein